MNKLLLSCTTILVFTSMLAPGHAQQTGAAPAGQAAILPAGNALENLIRERAAALDAIEAERNNTFRKRAEILVQREAALAEREKIIAARERQAATRETALAKRESAITSREAVVAARETMLGIEETAALVEKPRSNAPTIVGKYACVIDALTGAVLHEKHAHSKVAVASTQKLMTALLVVEAGDLDEQIIIQSEDVRVEPTRIGVNPGQRYTRRELVRALLIRSGNDIALALARDNAGSVEAFAEKMNARALSLGMTQTTFMNPHGLTEPGQGSSAHDMALLGRAAYAQPFIRECVATKSKTFIFEDGSTRALTNTNKVLSSFSPCNGMKTGYTVASGYCLVSSAQKDGKARIVVVLGSNGTWIWKDSHVLLEWAIRS